MKWLWVIALCGCVGGETPTEVCVHDPYVIHTLPDTVSASDTTRYQLGICVNAK